MDEKFRQAVIDAWGREWNDETGSPTIWVSRSVGICGHSRFPCAVVRIREGGGVHNVVIGGNPNHECFLPANHNPPYWTDPEVAAHYLAEMTKVYLDRFRDVVL